MICSTCLLIWLFLSYGFNMIFHFWSDLEQKNLTFLLSKEKCDNLPYSITVVVVGLDWLMNHDRPEYFFHWESCISMCTCRLLKLGKCLLFVSLVGFVTRADSSQIYPVSLPFSINNHHVVTREDTTFHNILQISYGCIESEPNYCTTCSYYHNYYKS